MHPFRLAVLAGSAIGVVSMLLPFASFPVIGPVNGVSADAWPALLPLIVALLFSATGRWSNGLDAGPGLVAVIAGATALVFSIVKLGDAVIATRGTAGAALGPGGFVLAGAALCVTIAAAVGALVRT